jgi:hypothetical protein
MDIYQAVHPEQVKVFVEDIAFLLELPIPTFTIKIKFVRFMNHPAEADADTFTIKLSRSHFKKHPNDVGCLVHELTHIVQAAKNYENNVWIIEGIADWVRAKFNLVEDKQIGWHIISGNPKEGYARCAHFLLWVEEKYGIEAIQNWSKQLYYEGIVTYDLEYKVREYQA